MDALRPATSRPLSEKREWNRGLAASHTMEYGGRFLHASQPSVFVRKRRHTMTRLGELLRAYQDRDPAARSRLEIFLLYPGRTRRHFSSGVPLAVAA